MGRARNTRIEADGNWPQLTNFLTAYLGENWSHEASSPEEALKNATMDYDLDGRKGLASEWWDWNGRIGWKPNLRRFLDEGFGMNIAFRDDDTARQFMNFVYDTLIVSIRTEEKGWKP